MGERLIVFKNLCHIIEMPQVLAERAADQAFGLAAMDHDRADGGGVGAHDRLRQRRRDAAARHEARDRSPSIRDSAGRFQGLTRSRNRRPGGSPARCAPGRRSTASGLPIRIGKSPVSSFIAAFAARSTRSSSPSAKTIRRSAPSARLEDRPHDKGRAMDRGFERLTIGARSSMGREAAPEAMAASATATATMGRRRGSNGFGIR